MLSITYKSKISNQVKKWIAVSSGNWKIYTKIFQFVARNARFFENAVVGSFLRRLALIDKPEKNFTQGYIVNLNVDVSEEVKNVTLPIEYIRKAVKESSYRAIMHKCICRDGNHCSEYPIDLGCIFLGEGARVTEERGVARSVTIEEALLHVDRAAEYGLIGQCVWIEAEQYVWGVTDEDLYKFLEVCFCCPCCCAAIQFYTTVGRQIQSRFQSVGWKASIDDHCDDCELCLQECKLKAISKIDSDYYVSDFCLGCGTCVSKCPKNAIKLKPLGETKETIEEYFFGFKPEL